jgi:dTDP-4-amino-4,6-dideoxygalactose transaminase
MPCDLNEIIKLTQSFKIPVVEDAACAIGSEIKINNKWEKIGKPHGDIACFSFHPRKVITTGDGGMITTNNPEYDKKFRLLRQHGMSVSDIARHSARKIIIEEYVTTGFNYRMTDIQASVGIEQLKKLENMIKERKRIAEIYRECLKGISWLKIPSESEYCKANWQSYPVCILDNSPLSRDELMQFLLDCGISTRPGIMNIHQEKAYDSKIYLKNSEVARKRVILLPFFYGISDKQIKEITEKIKDAR